MKGMEDVFVWFWLVILMGVWIGGGELILG